MFIVPSSCTSKHLRHLSKNIALLDACSQGTLIDESLFESFCLDCVSTNITVETSAGTSSQWTQKCLLDFHFGQGDVPNGRPWDVKSEVDPVRPVPSRSLWTSYGRHVNVV